ncbi:MAG TPA: phage regulatory CII family protein [Phycisphaerae bacterium]|nr:phage regulatory CII family protein [Phycisphaerae bacterium]
MMRSNEVLKQAVEPLGVKSLAARLKLSPALVYKWCQPHDANDPDAGGARNPLDRLVEIYEVTRDPEVINWICHKAGGFFSPNLEVEARAFHTELLVGTQKLVKEFSDMLEEVGRSIADDGRIELAEAARIRRHWETLKRVAESFVVAGEKGKYDQDQTTGR